MNRILKDPFIFVCLALVLYFCVGSLSKLWEEDPTPILQEAQKNYRAAEQTTDIAARKVGFNTSLKLLLGLEERYTPTFGNGKLYFDIGDNFFQLEEYPQALLYYYRAEKLRPSDDKVQSHLFLAQKKMGLPISTESRAFDWLFFFHTKYSLPERLQLFFAFTLLTFALASCYLWFPREWVKALAVVSLAASLPLLLSVCYTYCFAPIEGVIVQSNLMYKDAGINYAKVKPEPLLAGLKVKVLDVALAGKWLKIQTDDGTIGYIPQEAIRVI